MCTIFILFYPFGCSSCSCTNFAHSPLFHTFSLASFQVKFFSFEISAIVLFSSGAPPSFPRHPVLPYLLRGSAIIDPHQMSKPLELLLMYFFNIGSTFSSCLATSFLILSLPVIPLFFVNTSFLRPGFYFWCLSLASNSHNRMWGLGKKLLLLWSFL